MKMNKIAKGSQLICIKLEHRFNFGPIQIGSEYTVRGTHNIINRNSDSKEVPAIQLTNLFWYPLENFISAPDEVDRRKK